MIRFAAPLALAVLSLQASAQWSPAIEWGAAPFTPEYVYANGRLAAPDYRSFSGVVQGELDLHRIWIDAIISDGDALLVDNTQGIVDTAPTANAYGKVTHLVNTGTGTLSGSSTRLRCEHPSAGYCVGQKLTVSCAKPATWGCWGAQEGVGENVDTWRYIAADRGIPVSVPHIEVVAGDITVTQAVLQWNANPASTGDFLRIVGPNGIIFRVTAKGAIVTGSGRVIE